MYISKAKVSAVPYSIIVYVLILAGFLTYSAKMATDMMQKINFRMPVKSSTSLLQHSKDTSPSVNDNTIVLSYYWNRLGWKDSFSKSFFTDRQRKYAQHLSLESVYTPF